MPPGRYKLQADLAGFASLILPDVELLVGQNRSIPFTMQVASLAETLTVTAESPLVDISSTQVAGNVDRRQMEELPLQGRNWMELAMQVKGITANAVDTTPGVRDRQFQLNLDGQEITQQVAGSGFGQPKFSREAIAEFQVVTNLFDITQGRSLGIQVQADFPIGDQQPRWQRLRVLPGRQAQRRRISSPTACCRTRISRWARRSAARSSGSSSLLRVVGA